MIIVSISIAVFNSSSLTAVHTCTLLLCAIIKVHVYVCVYMLYCTNTITKSLGGLIAKLIHTHSDRNQNIFDCSIDRNRMVGNECAQNLKPNLYQRL